ncbi:hypothetical protein ILUMI_21694 [Ignelater luminosus]|uniref:Uncharacterized protein n=1 Tax=Ignelater luminosus TaxID=2038154 RepID=A0A8K0CFS5_IGNLU|nr:hypothetical protein ILUMI_21694 [Ignelater luminosus]
MRHLKALHPVHSCTPSEFTEIHEEVISKLASMKRTRALAAKKLSSLIDNAANKNNFSAWMELIQFPFTALRIPIKKSDDVHSQTGENLKIGKQDMAPPQCRCGLTVNSRRTHGLSCKFDVGRHPCHNELNDILKRALSFADVSSIQKPVGLLREDGIRPDGMTWIPWANGDATCSDTLAPSNLAFF